MKRHEHSVRILAIPRWIHCVHFTYVEAPFAAIQRVIPVKAAAVTLLDKVASSSRRCFHAWNYKPWNESRTYRAKHRDFIKWSKLGYRGLSQWVQQVLSSVNFHQTYFLSCTNIRYMWDFSTQYTYHAPPPHF